MKKFSKTLIPILAAILILCFCLVGCRSGFTVKFQTDGGTPVASQKVAKGEKAEKPAQPEKTGFEFGGWFTEPSCAQGTEYDFSLPVESDLVLYAKWTDKSDVDFFTITVVNGTGGGSYAYGSSVTLAAAAPSGKTFVKWTKDGKDFSTNREITVEVTANAVYEAVFSDRQYTLTYMLDGTVFQTQTYIFNQQIEAPRPDDTEDYRFVEWKDLPDVMPAQDITVVAEIVRLRAFVTVFGAEGTGRYDVGQELTLTATVPTGFEFGGWIVDGAIVETGASYTFKVQDDVEVQADIKDVNSTDYFIYDADTLSAKPDAAFPQKIILPSSYDGIYITKIASGGFKNQTEIVQVVLPDTVKEIGGSAFDGCNKLQNINLENVGILGDFAFNRCPSLLAADLSALLSAGASAFLGADSLETAILGENLQSISSSMFEGCSSLKQIVLTDGISSVEPSAFKNCTALEAIEIGSGVVRFAGNALNGCKSLKEINVNQKNSAFSSSNSILFDKSGIRLVLYPAGKTATSVNIGDGIKIVFEHAFENNPYIQSITLGADIEEIGNFAFAGLEALVTFDVKDGSALASIGEHAFDGCSSLLSFSAPTATVSIGKYAFAGCAKLETASFDGLASIPDYAFNGCAALTQINLGRVVSVGEHAFNDCSSLRRFDFTYVESLAIYAFSGCQNLDNVILNDKIPSLPDYVFNGCVSLTEISLPQTLSSVGQYALAGTGIVQAVLPQNVETVGDSAFEGCENLISATLGQKVRVLGASAFQNCISLSEITLNDGIEEIGNLAFANCSSLFVVKIPQSVVKVGKYAFLQNGQGLKILCVADSEPEGFDKEWNFGGYEVVWDCENQVENADFDFNLSTDEKYYILKGFASGKQAAELQLPSSHNGKPVKEIAAQAFVMNDSVVSVSIPASYVKIGDSAFYYCTSLASVTFAEGLEEIGKDAFRSCNLTSVSLPDGLKTLGEGTFRENAGLAEALIPDSVQTVGEGAFRKNSSSLVITCKASSKPDGWNEYWNYDDAQVVWAQESGNENEKNFVYKLSDDGTFYLVDGFADGVSLSEVRFPSEYDGKPVKGISNGMKFYGNTDITSVVCPSSFEILGDNAFYGCTNLESVTLNEGLKEIGQNAFRDCEKLKSVTVPFSVEIIKSGAFRGCDALTITCERTQEQIPATWDSNWNQDDCPVIWKDESES